LNELDDRFEPEQGGEAASASQGQMHSERAVDEASERDSLLRADATHDVPRKGSQR
jgi:hypothetical protein